MKYFFALISGFIVSAFIYFLAYFHTPFRSPSPLARTMGVMYDYKIDLLKKTPSPRIVVIAGSNGLYGINTQKLSEELGVPAVNLSIAMVVNLDFLFYTARQNLREGDTVILALEYLYYVSESANPATNAEFVMSEDKGYFLQLPLEKKLVWMFQEPAGRMFDSLWQSKERSRGEENRESVLRNLNEHGDLKGHGKDSSPAVSQAAMDAGMIDISACIDPATSRRSWQQISEFADWCKKNGVQLFATFPSTVYYPEYETGKSIDAQKRLAGKYESLGVPLLGLPIDFMWDVSSFRGTTYHLHEEAMIERTNLLASLLRRKVESLKLVTPQTTTR